MQTNTDGNPSECHQTENTKKTPGTVDEIFERLDKAYTKNWHKHISTINDIIKGKKFEVRKVRAQALALCIEVLELDNDPLTKFKKKDTHQAFNNFEISKPKLSSYNKFVWFFTKGPGKNVDDLMSYLRDKPRGTGNTKTGDQLKKLVYAFYADPRKLNHERIAELVNHAIRAQIADQGIDSAIEKFDLPNTESVKIRLQAHNYLSASSIKKLLTPEVRNIFYRKRYGAKEYRQHLVMPLYRKRPKNALDRVEVDSTVFSFMYYDRQKKAISIKLVTCLVVDCYSGKIIGYAFDKSENASLFIKALRNSFNTLGRLPAEIFTDRFPGHNNDEIKHFFTQIKSFGCNIEIERTGNARAKGTVEVTVNNLCELAKQYDNFIGKNITTKSKESRKSEEFVASNSRADQLKTIEQVKGQILSLIQQYNERKPNGRELSRRELFTASVELLSDTERILTLENRVWLFHKVLIKQVQYGGLIIFKKGFERYVYVISDHMVRFKYNNKEVRVRYNESDFEGKTDIWVFDTATDELICTCSQQITPHLAKVNHTVQDVQTIKDNIKANKEAREIIKRHELDLDSTSAEVSNYLISSKIESLNIEELHVLQSMQDNPRDIDSDIRTIENEDGIKEALIHERALSKKQKSKLIVERLDRLSAEPSLDRLRNYEGFYDNDTQEEEIGLAPNLDRLSLGMDDDLPMNEPTSIMIVENSNRKRSGSV